MVSDTSLGGFLAVVRVAPSA